MQFKRLLVAFLACLLLVSVLPTSFAAETPEDADDIWATIEAFEDNVISVRAIASGNRAAYKPTAADFAAMSEQVEALVVASDSFKPGTISRHGDFFFWETVDGEACGYSPRLRAQMREDAAHATADPEELAGIDTVSFSRGGSAGSMDVTSFQPYYGIDGSFTAQYANEATRIAKATGGTGTNYKTTAATIDAVANALQNSGVVIFDSHGDTDYANGEDYTSRANSSYLCMQTNAGWTSADQQAVQGPYGTYYHCWNGGSSGSMHYYMVDGTGFANHMTGNGCNNLLWMAICLGMATDGLNKPLHDKGVEVIYGYSQSVSFSGDYAYEAKFFDHLIDDYTAGESFAYMKQKCGCNWDPAYSSYSSEAQARNARVAFPILVSSEEPYPGHGNVDRVTTPKSDWTLLPQFEVTAVSNNTDWGTVSVSGSTITASPKEGYYTAGYEILEGTATVTQNGNVFTVKPESECTVQINFAAKTPAAVHFITPEGVSCADIASYVGDAVTLPKPTGTPTADAQDYTFLGWVEAELDNSTDRPSYQPAGTSVTLSGDVTFYALYTYAIADSGSTSTGFAQLQDDPVNWDGEYILTYQGSVVLDASGTYTGSALGSKDAAVAMDATGMTLDGNTIVNPLDTYTYVIEASTVTSGAYTIRMKDSGNYISYTGNTNSVTTTADPSSKSAQWNLSFSGGVVSFQNANTVGTAQVRYLQYNTTSKQFRCYTNTMKNLTVYTGTAGTRYYTTVLETATPHEHECALAIGLAPTCTEDGNEPYLYCFGCGKLFSLSIWESEGRLVEITMEDVLIPALGHDFGEWTVTTAPTCTAKGEETRTCARCGETETREVDETDHNYVNGVCTVCGAVDPDYKPNPENPFDDVNEGDYFLEPVLWAVNHEPQITNGTDPGKFSPDAKCSRGQVVTFLWRAKGQPEPTATENPFSDVSETEYYYKAVLWAVENEITTGTGNGKFSPNQSCTRGQVVTFLWRTEGKPAPASQENPFQDVAAGEYYFDAVLWAVEHNITQGTDPGKFSPNATCTRGQIVTFLYRDLAE